MTKLTSEDLAMKSPHDEVAKAVHIPSAADPSSSGKFWQKAKDAPLVPIGIAGGMAALFASVISYRNKSKSMKTSVYLIHTRLAVQGIIIGTLAGGAAYHLWADHVGPYLKGETKHL